MSEEDFRTPWQRRINRWLAPIKSGGPYLFLVAVVACAIGGMASCESDCRAHGGVLARGMFGYECVKGIRR